MNDKASQTVRKGGGRPILTFYEPDLVYRDNAHDSFTHIGQSQEYNLPVYSQYLPGLDAKIADYR